MLTHHQASAGARGLRPVTPAHRRAEDYARQWSGLPDGATKSSLLRLLEDVPARAMGLKPRERAFLHHLVKLQPAECFKPSAALAGLDLDAAGLALISTYADAYLMADLDVTCRTLARWREKTSRLGWISFRDSPDRTRYRIGAADAPEEAYGVDLRPLIVRYRELEALRDQDRVDRHELRTLRRTLSCRSTRIRSLLAVLLASEEHDFAQTALRAIEAVRRGKDLDMVRMAVAQADAAVGRLEALLDHQVWGSSGVTEESGAPDRNGAQLLPTQLEKIQIRESSLGRGALREEYAASTEPKPAETDALDDDGEVLWQSSATYDDDPAEDGQDGVTVMEITPTPAARRRPRVNAPAVGDIIIALPDILAQKDFPFTRHPMFPTDAALVVAYGQSAASRVGLTKEEICRHSAGDAGVPFAVAALLAEFTADVRNRRAYLLGLVARLNDPLVTVNLWASWKRLVRVSAPD